MGTGVVGDMMAMADVGVIWAEAEERRKGRRGDAKAPLLAHRMREKWSTQTSAGESPASTRAKITCKRLGEMAEAAFLAKASGLGFGVAKPWGDSDRYDFIVDVNGRLWRVQVKSAHRAGQDGQYNFRMFGHSPRAYREDEIDVLVAYIVPEDAWYVFPVQVFQKRRSLKLFSGSRRKRSKYEKYREAWWILREE